MEWTIAFVPEGILCGASILLIASPNAVEPSFVLLLLRESNRSAFNIAWLQFIICSTVDSLLGGSTAGYVNGRFVSFLRPVASGQVVGRRVFSRSRDVVCG
jgi:hypothetical protein